MLKQSNNCGWLRGSPDLYSTGIQKFSMIISNRLLVYNTRVRSDCRYKNRACDSKKFALPFLVVRIVFCEVGCWRASEASETLSGLFN